MVSRPMGNTAWMYVWPSGAWKGIERMRRVEKAGKVMAKRERVEFPKIWFWGLFLLGAVFLWVERKMGGMNG